jgi:hypothetical protein
MDPRATPRDPEPSAKQWIAFGVALVVLAFVAIWIAASRQVPEHVWPQLEGTRLRGTYRVAEVVEGCALDVARDAEDALFVVHPGRLPIAGPALHPCATEASCAARARERSLGVAPPPIPLALLGGGCTECGASDADVSWEDALSFPLGLDGASEPSARMLVAERRSAREAEGQCLRFRYAAELTRDGEGLVYERRVFFESAVGTCAEHPNPPTTCVAARRMTLVPVAR